LRAGRDLILVSAVRRCSKNSWMEKPRDPPHKFLLDAVRFELCTSELLLDTSGGDGLFRLRCKDPDCDRTALRLAPAPGLTRRHFSHDGRAHGEAHKQGAPPWDVLA